MFNQARSLRVIASRLLSSSSNSTINKSARSWFVLLALFAVSVAASFAQAPTPVPVLTWRYDLTAAGQNTNETLLTPANVNPNSFGKLFSLAVDSTVYAQPLYVPNLQMSDGQIHNVLFVATENDSIYAYDADSNGGANAKPIWQISLLTSAHGAGAGATAVPWQDSGSPDVAPTVGITGTPTIDPATKTMYVVANTKENGAYFSRLHAINIVDGTEKLNGPVDVTATVAGTGNGSTGGQLSFSALWSNQRTALSLYNGHVYFGYGAHGDNGPWHGWLFSYDATTLHQTAVLCLTPNHVGAGLWASGAAMPIDVNTPGGKMFLVTGNGTRTNPIPYTANSEYGESIVAISLANGGLTPVDSFTSYNYQELNNHDYDQGSGGVLMIPDHNGPNPHMLIQAGKEGRISVLNRDNLGGYIGPNATSNTNSLQDITGVVPVAQGFWSTGTYWNGNVYYWAEKNVPMLFKLNNGVLSTQPDSKSPITAAFPAPSFSVSSNGTQDGVAWALRSDQFNSNGPGVLYAWDANDLTKLLYESDTNSKRDAGGPANKFSIPVVTNGKVYVAAHGQVDVYGLLNGAPTAANPVITPNGGTFSTSQNVQIASATGSATIYYTLDGTAPTPASNVYTAPITVSTNTTIKAIASAPGFVQSGVTTANFTFNTQAPDVTFAPAGGTYLKAQTVTLSLSRPDNNAKIYYTVDGSTPTAASTPYTAPLNVGVSETIQAIAIDPTLTDGNIAMQDYVIQNGGQSIDFGAGFSNSAGLTFNGSAVASNDTRLQLTTGDPNQAGSVFWNTPINIQAFTTTFNFQLSNAAANGFTFTIQNAGLNALGGNSAGLGYQDIQKSVAVKFNFYDFNGEGNNSTGLYTNGQPPVLPTVDIPPSLIQLSSGDAIQATLTYDGTTLSLDLLDLLNGKHFSTSWPIDIPSTVGGNAAYVGFTGGTGGLSSSQKLTSWTYATKAVPPAFTPAAGTYPSSQNVKLSSKTADAAIYYTTDGSTPNANSTQYTTPIAVAATETLKALAISSTYGSSDVISGAYTIQSSQPAATFTLNGSQASDVDQGASTTSTISVTPANSFTGNVALACSVTSAPPAAISAPTCTIAKPPAITGTQPVTAQLTINTQANTTIGSYIVTVAGTSGTVSATVPVPFNVTGKAATPDFTVTGNAINIPAPGANGTSVITVTPSEGFTGSIKFSCAVNGGPAGAIDTPACSIADPPAITGTQPVTSTLTITTQGTTSPGNYIAAVSASSSASSGAISRSVNLAVTVSGPTAAPSFSLSGTPITITSPATSGTSPVSVTPAGGFTGAVTVACTISGGPAAATSPTCSVTQPASIAGTQAVTSTVTVSTQSNTTPGNYTAQITGTAGSVTNSTTLAVTVVGPTATPSFSLSGTPIAITSPTTTGSSTITVTPSGGFTGAVTLGCTVSGGSAGSTSPTCTVTQPPSISGTQPVTGTVAISMSTASASAQRDIKRNLGLGGGGLLMAAFLFCAPFRRRSWQALIGILLFVIVVATASGCGSSSKITGRSYTITVTGSSGTTQASTTVPLSVN